MQGEHTNMWRYLRQLCILTSRPNNKARIDSQLASFVSVCTHCNGWSKYRAKFVEEENHIDFLNTRSAVSTAHSTFLSPAITFTRSNTLPFDPSRSLPSQKRRAQTRIHKASRTAGQHRGHGQSRRGIAAQTLRVRCPPSLAHRPCHDACNRPRARHGRLGVHHVRRHGDRRHQRRAYLSEARGSAAP